MKIECQVSSDTRHNTLAEFGMHNDPKLGMVNPGFSYLITLPVGGGSMMMIPGG